MLRTYELSKRAEITIEGAVTWAFMFNGQPYFDGFRDLATNGVDKAVLNGFRMLGKLKGDWLDTQSSHRLDIEEIMTNGVRGKPDVNLVATRDERGISILAWHYHDDDEPGPDADLTIAVEGWGGRPASLRHYRMDEGHSNSFAVWEVMGRPENPIGADFTKLEAAGNLAVIGEAIVEPEGGPILLRTRLPLQGVSLLRLNR
jgi:xylan 1,4-beta-xylosidase